jgi:hypothetical protein
VAGEEVREGDVAAFWRCDIDVGGHRVPERVLAPEVRRLGTAAVAMVDGVAGLARRGEEEPVRNQLVPQALLGYAIAHVMSPYTQISPAKTCNTRLATPLAR